jgi:hypothetical protein
VKRKNAILSAVERPRRQREGPSSKLSTAGRQDALEKARKQQQIVETEIDNMVARHREEMLRKNKELICLQLRYDFEASSETANRLVIPLIDRRLKDELAMEKVSRVVVVEKLLTAELATEEAARIAVENGLKDAKGKHQVNLKERESHFEEQLGEKW